MAADGQGSKGLPRSGAFLSYARADGADMAATLRVALSDAGVTVWQDLADLAAGDRWWQEVRDAVGRVACVVLVLTDGALRSAVVQRELRLARQEGVVVRPVLANAGALTAPVPRWLQAIHWYDPARDLPALLLDLRRSPSLRRVPFMAEPLPADFVQRSGEFDRIVDLLLGADGRQAVAITAALRGAGGYGKTTLARAVCEDPRVLDNFDDGVLWITLGERPSKADLIEHIADLVETLEGDRPGFAGLDAASARLRAALEDRALLFVIDDVWQPAHLAPFLGGGTRCVRLVTTRNSDTLPSSANSVAVDEMRAEEACDLLGQGLPGAGAAALRRLAARLGEWPLLLKLANGVLRRRIDLAGQDLSGALAWMHQALDRRGVVAFDARDAEERNRAVARTIRLSMEGLDEREVERFFDLAVFAEDLDIPLAVLTRYWDTRGGLDAFEAEELCERLHAMSLLQQLDLRSRTVRLHDAIRHFLIDVSAPAALAARHAGLLAALSGAQAPWEAAPHDPYLLRHLGHHLAGAGRPGEMGEAVCSLRYAGARVLAHQSWSLLEDLQLACRAAADAAQGDDGTLLARLMREIARCGHVLDRIVDPVELVQTLACRMAPLVPAGRQGLDAGKSPALLASQPLPGLHSDLERTISMPDHGLRNCVFLPRGDLLAAGARDGQAWVFDCATGRPQATLSSHTRPVNALCAAPDGQWLASVCDEGRLVVWDPSSGTELGNMQRAPARLLCCDVNPQGTLLIAGGGDNRLHVWALDGGRIAHTLAGHAASITGCCFSRDGTRALTASADGSWALWNPHDGACLHMVPTRGLPLTCCAFASGDNWVVTGSSDGSLSVWDRDSGCRLQHLVGHVGAVRACGTVAAGQWLVSAGDDATVRLWNLASGRLQKTLQSDGGPVRALAGDAAGARFASVRRDGTLNLWRLNVDAEPERLPAAEPPLQVIAVDPDGRTFLTTNARHLLCLWDARAGDRLPQSQSLAAPLSGAPLRACLSAGAAHAAVATARDGLVLWPLCDGGPARQLGAAGLRPWFSFTPDGSQLVWRNDVGELLVESLSPPGPTRRLQGDWSDLDDAAFGDADAWLTGVAHGKVVVIDLRSGESRLPEARDGIGPGKTGSFTLSGHAGRITQCRFDPTGQVLLTTSEDGSAAAWDCRTGLRQSAVVADTHWAGAVATTPDGATTCTAWWNGAIRSWSTASAEFRRHFVGHTAAVVDLALSGDGRRLLSASWDGSLRLWDVATGDGLCTLRHSGPLNCCAIENRAGWAAAGDTDGGLLVWRLVDGAAAVRLVGHTQQVNRCRISPDGRLLVSVADDGTAKVWDLRSQALLRTLRHGARPVVDADVDSSFSRLLTVGWDDTAALWDLASGSCIGRVDLDERPGPVLACALSPDGRQAAIAKGRTIHIVEPGSGWRVARVLPGRFGHALSSPLLGGSCLQVDGRPVWLDDGDRRLALSNDRRHAVCWFQAADLPQITLALPAGVLPLPALEPGTQAVTGCALSPDGRLAAFLFDDGVIRVCDTQAASWLAAVHTGDTLTSCDWLLGGQRLVVSGAMGLHWLDWTPPRQDTPGSGTIGV